MYNVPLSVDPTDLLHTRAHEHERVYIRTIDTRRRYIRTEHAFAPSEEEGGRGLPYDL